MIRRQAIRKIFITTLSLFILITISTITNICSDDKSLKVNLELEDITGLTNHSVYLLNKNNYLVRKKVFLDGNDSEEIIKKILGYLKINDNTKYSSNLAGLIPKNCSYEVKVDESFVTLDFNKAFLNVKNIDLTVTSIVHSIYDLENIKGITILVDGDYIDGYPKIINNNIDINRETFITSRDNITKVVIYYLLNDNDEMYYVPVTKYLNDSREKINIVVDEMKTSTSNNLVSLVNSNIELISSREDNDTMILNFNNFLFDSNDEVLEEVLYCISYSVFDNYDVDMVMLEVNGKNISTISRGKI